MRIIHNITHDVDGAKTSTFVIYETSQNCDLWQAIHDAALDYFLAEYKPGTEVRGLSYADFVLKAPSEFCEKYGVKKALLQDTTETFDGNQLLLSRFDIKRQLEDQKKVLRRRTAMRNVFGNLAKRMDAAKKQSPAVAEWSPYQISKQMLVWAEEFVDKYGDASPYEHLEQSFVSDKLAAMMRAEKMPLPRYN
ncbi:MAG: hypothetical protein HDT20_08135 [Oscillibacter sp.]|nr:hypothetical protein [Oscillibacter sp.]